jgi:hypothetical protein
MPRFLCTCTGQASGYGWRAWCFRRWSGASLPTVRLLAISPLCARHQEPLTGIEREQRHVTIGSRDTAVIAIAPSLHRAKLAGKSIRRLSRFALITRGVLAMQLLLVSRVVTLMVGRRQTGRVCQRIDTYTAERG